MLTLRTELLCISDREARLKWQFNVEIKMLSLVPHVIKVVVDAHKWNTVAK